MGDLGYLTWVKLHQPQEQHKPLLTVCAVFLCPVVWLPVFVILTGVDVCVYIHTGAV